MLETLVEQPHYQREADEEQEVKGGVVRASSKAQLQSSCYAARWKALRPQQAYKRESQKQLDDQELCVVAD